jgi:hypothetical protein
MGIKLGDRNETVRLWRIIMAKRFSGYSRVVGDLPIDTDEFGPRAQSWQAEYERRIGERVDGIVSDENLRALGIPVPRNTRPVLFTVHGTGQPVPDGPGLPADTARAVLDIYDWQPIGNYPATPFPMWPSITKGQAELQYQAGGGDGGRWKDRDIALAGYSQGAVVVGQFLKHDVMDPKGAYHHLLPRIKKVVFWGNPMREEGVQDFDNWIHDAAPADSHGILEDRLEGLKNAPFQVRDFAHKKDMYSCNFDNDTDEYKRAICKIVMRATDFWNGPDSVVHQLIELATRPLQEGIAIAMSMIQAGGFFTATGIHSPHAYNMFPAVDFLRA